MRSRRALSSVVGMVFAIIALTSTVIYITYSMNTVNQYNQSVIGRTQEVQNTVQENFQITGASITNGKFNITLSNTGILPVNITKVWIQNTTSKDVHGNYWTKSYVPDNKFAMPGNTVTNIGMSFPGQIVSANGYQIKLVTSRGNMQQFTMSSTNVPLNMQLLTMPPTLTSGSSTELMMIVTNNSTGVLTNVVPQTPQEVTTGPDASTATCTLGSLNNPTSYSTLGIGQTAIFSWSLTASGNNDNTCTYSAQLEGSTQTSNATVKITTVPLVPATTYAQYSGILTMNYTSFRWTVTSGTGSNGWNVGWSPTGGQEMAVKINLINNNSTAGSNFYISKYSVLYTTNVGPGNSATMASYIMNYYDASTQTASPYSCSGPPTSDYCLSVPPGGTVTLYFFAKSPDGSSTTEAIPSTGSTQAVSILMLGKYASCQNCPGTMYGQQLPYIGIVTS